MYIYIYIYGAFYFVSLQQNRKDNQGPNSGFLPEGRPPAAAGRPPATGRRPAGRWPATAGRPPAASMFSLMQQTCLLCETADMSAV